MDIFLFFFFFSFFLFFFLRRERLKGALRKEPKLLGPKRGLLLLISIHMYSLLFDVVDFETC